MRSKFQAEERKVKELEEENAKLEDVPSREELDEATNLLAASRARLDELEAQAEEKNKEIEELRKKSNEQQTRAKSVLSNAKQRIEKVTEEKKLLQQELDTLTAGGSGLSDEQELRRKAMASQLNSLRQDKEKLEAEKNEAAVEKEKMMEQIEALQQELVAAQLASQQKPVAVAGVVHQQDKVGAGTGARKQQQPQAHIQPQTRPQTASIRPTVQARPGPAVVLPSQVSSVGGPGQVDHVATVQPTLTSGTSTSAASSTPQHPSTSQPQISLDPTAAEFIPIVSVASSGSNEVMEDPPRAVVTPRQDQPQASTSGPVVTSVSSTPTTSGTTTASVQPTLKRPRESTLAESDSMSSNSEDRAGPSGYQKKARTISSTEFLQVSSGGA